MTFEDCQTFYEHCPKGFPVSKVLKDNQELPNNSMISQRIRMTGSYQRQLFAGFIPFFVPANSHTLCASLMHEDPKYNFIGELQQYGIS